jgi:HEAT repeat protein
VLTGIAFLVVVAFLIAGLRGSDQPSPLALRREPEVDRLPLAAACGLTEIGTEQDGAVAGRHGVLRARLETLRGLPYGLVRVRIEGLAHGVKAVRAGSRSGTPSLDVRDVTVGDPDFDAAVVLQGTPATVRGLFGARARERALRAFAIDARIHVAEGVLVAEIDELTAQSTSLEAKVTVLLELAHSLEPGKGDEQRLGEILRGDPHPGVRAVALETLGQIASRPRARDVLRGVLKDGPPGFRLQAAVALGDEGRPSLHALAADPVVDDVVSSAAVTALGGHVTFARAAPLLERAVADVRPQTAAALLKVMGRGSAAEAETIAAVLARLDAGQGPSPRTAAVVQAAVDALVATGAPAAEPALLRALGSPVAAVALSAAQGLGRIGGVGAVPALRDAEERGGELRSAARQAIAAIQSRRPGASPGQVSLAGGETGQISIASATDGSLSLPPDDPPR